jgi:glycerate-2-kinase
LRPSASTTNDLSGNFTLYIPTRPSQNAGALVAPDSLARSRAQGLDPRKYLAANDSHGIFSALGDLVVTGPTRTNVNDYRAILIA